MKIGFYGHSNCAYLSNDSFLNLFAEQLNAEIVNTGARQGSEERILYELKKTKQLDLAVIFHSYPNYLFLPGCDRDFDVKSVVNNHANHIWKSVEVEKIISGWEHHLTHHTKFIKKFQTVDNFVNVLKSYKDYLYDPDLQVNRFYGALIQIDQYLTTKNILTIHIVEQGYLPKWFKFSSGIEDSSIIEIAKKTKLEKTDSWCANGITKEGNILVAKRLSEIYAACSR
jgi:hypothetical protein